MDETYDKLIDIIAVDIKLAIELIKGQDIDVEEFVIYLMEWRTGLPNIDTIILRQSTDQRGFHHNILPSINITEWLHTYDDSIIFREKLSKYLNKLKNEQN